MDAGTFWYAMTAAWMLLLAVAVAVWFSDAKRRDAWTAKWHKASTTSAIELWLMYAALVVAACVALTPALLLSMKARASSGLSVQDSIFA